MKKFLHMKWLSIPVIIVLVLALTAGGVFAAYNFWSVTAKVDVVEAIAVGAGTWDNLAPYGAGPESLDDVNITFGEDTLTISTAADSPYVGEGFCPGEWIVIPLNIRNGSDGALTLTASASGGGGLVLDASYEINTGAQTEPVPEGHEGDFLAYGFKDHGVFTPLDQWSTTVEGNSGQSGSAVHGAQVLFVRISAPGDVPAPATYDLTVTLSRN